MVRSERGGAKERAERRAKRAAREAFWQPGIGEALRVPTGEVTAYENVSLASEFRAMPTVRVRGPSCGRGGVPVRMEG